MQLGPVGMMEQGTPADLSDSSITSGGGGVECGGVVGEGVLSARARLPGGREYKNAHTKKNRDSGLKNVVVWLCKFFSLSFSAIGNAFH